MSYTSIMTSKGQVTIPVEVRRKLSLKPGEPVRFEMHGNTVTVHGQGLQSRLTAIHKKVAAHMRERGLAAPTDAELDRAIDEAWAAASDQYNKAIQNAK